MLAEMMESCHTDYHNAEMVVLQTPMQTTGDIYAPCGLSVLNPFTICFFMLHTTINKEESTSSCCHIITSMQGFLSTLSFAR